MTKPMKTIVATLTVCTAIAFTNISIVNATPNDGFFDDKRSGQSYKHQGKKHQMKRMIKALSLSEQQQEQIKTIKTEAREQGQELRVSMTEFKVAQKALIHAKTFDENAFNTLQDQYQSVFSDYALIKTKARHAVFNILTTEQQNKWLKIIERKKSKRNAKKRDA